MEQIKQYVDFIEKPRLSAKEYVVKKFQDYDIVIICERQHRDTSQYELFFQIAQDAWFQENVGHIFTEIGTVNSYPLLHRLLFNMPNLSPNELEMEIIKIVRDYSWSPCWNAWNYPNFIKRIYWLNESLPIERKIDLIPSDFYFDWNKINTSDDYDEFYWGKFVNDVWKPVKDRDSVMYEHIVMHFDSIQQYLPRKKALTILNFRHAFEQNTNYGFAPEDLHTNTGKLLKDKYGNKVASVYLNGLGWPKSFDEELGYTIIQEGRWDAAFKITNKYDVGFDFAGSPFGKDKVDLTPFSYTVDSLCFSDLFTGFIYYLPISEHIQIYGIDGFVDDEFRVELERRVKIFIESWEQDISIQDFIENLCESFWGQKILLYDNLEEMESLINKIVEDYKSFF